MLHALWLPEITIRRQGTTERLAANSKNTLELRTEEWPSWLKAAVLRIAREYSRLIQINNLRHTVPHRNGVFWAALAAFCATARILCNSLTTGF